MQNHVINAVTVGLSGGLGNQMFQYAAGRALSLRLGVPLHLDLSWFFGRKDRRYALAPFAISGVPRKRNLLLPNLLKSWESKVARRYATKRMGVPIFRERHFHFDSAFKRLSAPVYLEGYWQSELYFLETRDALLREFSLREHPPEACLLLAERIASNEAICVHVRRGDYVSDRVTAGVHGLCTMEYYEQAIPLAAQGLENPHCFVFSDDPAWVRSHFVSEIPMTVVDANSATEAHWDLHLMSQCRHFVIANSSLSWWGAWLCAEATKRVVAPARWFQSSRNDTRDLIPESWRKV